MVVILFYVNAFGLDISRHKREERKKKEEVKYF